jgi:uncharacterized protein (TIGR03435 family)
MDVQNGLSVARWRSALIAISCFASVPLTPPAVGAQRTMTREKPRFDEASIKPTKSERQSGPYFMPGGRFRASACTLRLLIRIAYSYGGKGALESHQIVGGPEWIDSERFDIDAIAETGAVDPVALLRLQTLLEDRFKLSLRTETRQMPIYALVLARSDRTLGPRIQRSTIECVPGGTAPLRPPSKTADALSQTQCGLRSATNRLSGAGVEMSSLVRELSSSSSVDRLVPDETGLTGRFDLDLTWTEFDPSIFVAIEEQLGLKLESRRGPVEVGVIDSVERPAPNP